MGLVAAVRRYVSLDHEAERARWYSIVATWQASLAGIPGVEVTLEHRNEAGQPVPRLHVGLTGESPCGTARAAIERLRAGDPCVEVLADREVGFWIGPDLVTDEEVPVVGAAVRAVLTGTPSSR